MSTIHHNLYLPEEIIVTILEKVQDTKTLVRCSLVSKRFRAIISEIDTVLLSYVCNWKFPSCSEPHYHIPLKAVPALMKVFANVKYLKVKLCNFIITESCGANHASMLKANIDDDEIDVQLRVAIQVGNLTREFRLKLSSNFHGLSIFYFRISQPETKNCLHMILRHRPKTLRSIVISFAKDSYRFGGKIFMTGDQLNNLWKLDQLRKLYRRPLEHQHDGWFEDPKNAVYWLKKQHEGWLEEPAGNPFCWLIKKQHMCTNGENLWHMVHQSESLHKSTAERELKELMGDFD